MFNRDVPPPRSLGEVRRQRAADRFTLRIQLSIFVLFGLAGFVLGFALGVM